MTLNHFDKSAEPAPANHGTDTAMVKIQCDAHPAPPGPNQKAEAVIPAQAVCADTSANILPPLSLVSYNSTVPNARVNEAGAGRLSVGMAWNSADNLKEDSVTTMARHNLVFAGPESFGLKWDNAKYPGLATDFTKESINRAQAQHEELVAKNPRISTLAEIRYRDAPSNYLPQDSKWWQRDSIGRIVEGYPGKDLDYKMLDIRNPEFQDHVAAQAAATIKSGAVGGVMLDWFNDGNHKSKEWDDARVQMLTKIRSAIDAVDPHAKIFINTNAEQVPDKIARLVNGYYMECNRSSSADDWKKITAATDRAEQQGKIPFVETWPDRKQGREELHKMRAGMTMVMTHAPNGYALFADPDGANKKEHLHDWYNFYDTKPGKPIGPVVRIDGSSRREYQNGTVVYNPIDNKPVTVMFREPRTSAATHQTGLSFVVNPDDGDVFVR